MRKRFHFGAWLMVLGALVLPVSVLAGRSFNGTSDVLTIPGNGNAIDIAGQQISISMWFFLSAMPGSEQDPLGKCQAAGQCQYLFVVNASGHANQVGFYLRDNVPINHDQFTFCSTVLTTPAWHNVVIAVDITGPGTNGLLYLDGAQCGTLAINNTGFITTTGSSLLIGGSANSFFSGAASKFGGVIAEVGIWNLQLNANEALALAKGIPAFRVRRTGLVGYWPIWGAASPEPDLSGNVSNAVLTGTTVANHCPCAP